MSPSLINIVSSTCHLADSSFISSPFKKVSNTSYEFWIFILVESNLYIKPAAEFELFEVLT